MSVRINDCMRVHVLLTNLGEGGGGNMSHIEFRFDINVCMLFDFNTDLLL